ncbi:hypothetical protein COCON_G00046220 [Conger conger]|uniref:Uncharacterized protein n=1 Tax=Conger conger TaxID=82655 RepID=A0A9Q1I569_CONCO|nr:hypothetical protein COCON_G00046220 [Conger conger]
MLPEALKALSDAPPPSGVPGADTEEVPLTDGRYDAPWQGDVALGALRCSTLSPEVSHTSPPGLASYAGPLLCFRPFADQRKSDQRPQYFKNERVTINAVPLSTSIFRSVLLNRCTVLKPRRVTVEVIRGVVSLCCCLPCCIWALLPSPSPRSLATPRGAGDKQHLLRSPYAGPPARLIRGPPTGARFVPSESALAPPSACAFAGSFH